MACCTTSPLGSWREANRYSDRRGQLHLAGDAVSHILRCPTARRPPPRSMAPAPHQHPVRAALAAVGPFSPPEQPTAWHNDHPRRNACSAARGRFDTMIRWNADWLRRGLPLHHKPTHYEGRRRFDAITSSKLAERVGFEPKVAPAQSQVNTSTSVVREGASSSTASPKPDPICPDLERVVRAWGVLFSSVVQPAG
jgi:hypothetical protein